jgi:hypothetical protein
MRTPAIAGRTMSGGRGTTVPSSAVCHAAGKSEIWVWMAGSKSFSSPISVAIWVSERRTRLLGSIAAIVATIAVTNPPHSPGPHSRLALRCPLRNRTRQFQASVRCPKGRNGSAEITCPGKTPCKRCVFMLFAEEASYIKKFIKKVSTT